MLDRLTPEHLVELRQIAEAATPPNDQCPRCGVPWTLGRDVGGRVHTPGGMDCLSRQLAQAKEQLKKALAREAQLRMRVVDEFTDFTEHGGRFVLRPMAETITVNGVVYTPIQWVYDYLEIIDHQIRLQAERALALLDSEKGGAGE